MCGDFCVCVVDFCPGFSFQLGALFYWNSYQIRQFPFQVDLSTFDKIVIFGVSEMVNIFNNTSVPI